LIKSIPGCLDFADELRHSWHSLFPIQIRYDMTNARHFRSSPARAVPVVVVRVVVVGVVTDTPSRIG